MADHGGNIICLLATRCSNPAVMVLDDSRNYNVKCDNDGMDNKAVMASGGISSNYNVTNDNDDNIVILVIWMIIIMKIIVTVIMIKKVLSLLLLTPLFFISLST